jgi:uncharacterized Fe-S cluster-containing protein
MSNKLLITYHEMPIKNEKELSIVGIFDNSEAFKEYMGEKPYRIACQEILTPDEYQKIKEKWFDY